MDHRLEDVDKILATMDDDDTERELAFAVMAMDANDPATLNWLAACAVAHAHELKR